MQDMPNNLADLVFPKIQTKLTVPSLGVRALRNSAFAFSQFGSDDSICQCEFLFLPIPYFIPCSPQYLASASNRTARGASPGAGREPGTHIGRAVSDP